MPEGVECLIVAESIQKWAQGQDTNHVGYTSFNLEEVYNKVVTRNSPISPTFWNEHLNKLNYYKISTFGKTIFLPFENFRLSIQLGMTGTFSEQKTDHSRIRFCSDYSSLYYNDMRKFGHIMCFEKHNPPRNISNLLKNSIDWRNKNAPELFAKRVVKRKQWIDSEIKPLLMNQQLIAGIGNIYACEGLLLARIDPRTKVKDIPSKKLAQIIVECQNIMNKSYSVGGMSVYTFTSFGKQGFGKRYLNVYNQQGILCNQCKSSIIQKTLQQGRSTYYCPTCQK